MSKSIMIVDDRPEDIKLIRKLLEQVNEDFRISSVDSGQDALMEAQAKNPDVILLDTLMPGLDGWETCRELKKLPCVSSKVIMITGSLDAVSEAKAQEVGADGYCVKFADSILSTLLEHMVI